MHSPLGDFRDQTLSGLNGSEGEKGGAGEGGFAGGGGGGGGHKALGGLRYYMRGGSRKVD